MKIIYDGVYPTLCGGKLVVITDDGNRWEFPDYCMRTEGYCILNDEEEIVSGAWKIIDWPETFPEELKESVIEKINAEIPWGCCGGCI